MTKLQQHPQLHMNACMWACVQTWLEALHKIDVKLAVANRALFGPGTRTHTRTHTDTHTDTHTHTHRHIDTHNNLHMGNLAGDATRHTDRHTQ